MGSYNADSAFNVQQGQIIARDYNFLANVPILGDQWTLDSATAVSSFRDGLGISKFKVKYNPLDLLT